MQEKKGPKGKQFGVFPPRYSQNYILNGTINPKVDTIMTFLSKIKILFLIFRKEKGGLSSPPNCAPASVWLSSEYGTVVYARAKLSYKYI